MEDLESDEIRAWIEAQNEFTFQFWKARLCAKNPGAHDRIVGL
jgi:prolyl oligopeptidase PreP (S9A serine peptidase family)